jgi:hypothetical protein
VFQHDKNTTVLRWKENSHFRTKKDKNRASSLLNHKKYLHKVLKFALKLSFIDNNRNTPLTFSKKTCNFAPSLHKPLSASVDISLTNHAKHFVTASLKQFRTSFASAKCHVPFGVGRKKNTL